MTDTPLTSSDCYRIIHKSLGLWIAGALGDGFQSNPVLASGEDGLADELMSIAAMMREIEDHTDLLPTSPKQED